MSYEWWRKNPGDRAAHRATVADAAKLRMESDLGNTTREPRKTSEELDREEELRKQREELEKRNNY